jgi:hypothetical protein
MMATDDQLKNESCWFTAKQVSGFIGVSRTTFKNEIQQRLPAEFMRKVGNRNEFYGPAVVEIRCGQRRRSCGKVIDDPGADDPMLASNATTPALERYRETMTNIKKLELGEKAKTLIPRESVHDLMTRLASKLRGCITRIKKSNGGEQAAGELIETIRDFESDVDRYCNTGNNQT